jgi:L-lactate utilization protein LutC
VSGETFLQRVRTAAHNGRAYRVTPGEVTDQAAGVGYVGGGADLVATFAAELTAVGGHAYIVTSLAEAADTLHRLLAARAIRSAICSEHDVLARLGLDELLAERGIAALQPSVLASQSRDQRRRQILEADVGITSADYAIAETGSLVLLARPGQERLISLAPAVHVAMIEAKQVLPDLFDLFAELAARGLDQLTSNVTIITGPSKTGDIELQLTTGVHGPGEVHVIILQEAG